MSDLLKHFRASQEKKPSEKTYATQCPYCSVQCSMELLEERIVSRRKFKAKPNRADSTSQGRMCIKGANAHQHVIHRQRIEHPLLKIDGEFVRIPWELALSYMTEQFQHIQGQNGRDTVGVYGGGSLTNEEAYLLGKFARVALQTKHIDYNGRFCMSAAAAAGNAAFGMDRGLTAPLADIPETKCIILAGTNIADCQPTLMPYFRKAKKNGAFIIAIDPRQTGTTKIADLHLQVKPGTDDLLAKGMLHVILREGLVDEAFIAERTVGFEEVREEAAAVDLRTVAEWTGVPEEDIELAAKQYGEAPSGMLFTARGVEQHAGGYETVRQLQNVVLAAGKIGKAGCGYGAITGQGNGQGGREHGQKADQLPGYRSIENREHRAYIADVWGIDEKELPYKGVSAFEMMEKVDREEIRGLFIMGSNPVVSNPHATFVERALQKCEFIVVADLFMSETARMADLILPTSSYLEDEGTMTNVEGRVTLRSATRKRPGEVKHDWQIICEAADHLGKGDFFRFESAEEIFEELRIASKGGTADYFGVTYERLRNGEDLFWPCTSEEHPGTPRLFEEQFAHEDGKARFSPGTGDYHGPLKQDLVSKRYPLHLTTGRVMEHYLTGVQTRRSEALRLRSGEPLLEIHPGTAEQYGITDGAYVHVESAQGSMILRANVSDTIRPDTMFIPFHWGDVQCVNRLTPPELDPVCKMPEFKVFAVNIRAATGNTQGIYVSREA